jgi:hypothetical protein
MLVKSKKEFIKLSVQTNILFSFVTILILGSYSLAFGQTSATCSNPSGRISCESRQAAVCDSTTGRVDGTCKTPPRRGMTIDEIRAWLLSFLFNKEVSVGDIRGNSEYQQILRERRIESGGRRITFELPRELDNSPVIETPTSPDKPLQPQQPNPTPDPSIPPILQGDPKVDRPPIIPVSPNRPDSSQKAPPNEEAQDNPL